ncbi:SGNH/GDSL hydrolase family protein [Glutamicibacter sp. NPDC087831]|uniref:SGNH/GDSL hydrolase family protein n=1 Tax=Glutamicibacter sp. NPDC087831 TaxID=3363998 RepID=UPI00382DFAD1
MAIEDSTVSNMGFALPVGTDFISAGDNAISQNARAAAEGIANARWKKGTIPNGVDIREYMYGKDGQYTSLLGSSTATMTGLPAELVANPVGFTAVAETLGNGTTITLTDYSVWSTNRWVCTSAPSTGDGWSRWNKIKWDNGETNEAQDSANKASGFKTLPLILTAGRGGGEALAPLSANVEYDVNLSPAIHVSRYRLAIRDGNPRWGTFTAQRIALSNISFGGVQKLTSMATDSTGAITYSRWFEGDFGNLKFDYVAPQQPRYIIGGGKLNGTRRTEMPFELWLEVEVPANTPAIGLVGDSNSVGVNTTIPIHDAWMSIYCRNMGFFPVLYGHSGDGTSQAQTVDHYKWNRWNHLDRPDMVVHANGANDIPSTEGGVTLAQLQDWARAEWAISDEKISKNKHAAVIKSRASGINNTVRVQYNNWIKSKPDPIRDWQDIASPVTANDAGGLLAQYISSDNIHMNTAGQTAIATSGLKVMTVRTGLVFNQTAGRTVKAWDYLNQREQLIYGDTGERRMTDPAFAGGSLDISRQGNLVTLNIVALKFFGTGTVSLSNFIPVGFRPRYVVLESAAKYWSTDTDGTARVTSSGTFMVPNVQASTQISLAVTWRTDDPWPTTLPGTAA